MAAYSLTIRPGHPDFLDLPWETPLATWQSPRLVDRPRGISRHEVRFVEYDAGTYVIKELPQAAARRDYAVLQDLEGINGLAVTPVGVVEGRGPSTDGEASAALITHYLEHSFSFRELLEGPGFGARRQQLLDAFAGLLVELHLAGCFWGDCSLSNVLYRFDALAVDAIMVDAETAFIVDQLSKGQREEDLEIMIQNVAGGMGDIAAQHGITMDHADLWLGEDIATRYRSLWRELAFVDVIDASERHRIQERIARLNALGFDVNEVDLRPSLCGGRLEVAVRSGGRHFHSRRLRELTGIAVSEWQAWQLLSDMYYFGGSGAPDVFATEPAALTAVEWRARVFEPMVHCLRNVSGVADPVQAFCDVLHHRYVRSQEVGADIGTETAFRHWLQSGRPGYTMAIFPLPIIK